MRVHDSARRHGIADEDSIQAAEWAVWIEDLDDDHPQRQLRLGFDTHGRLLEVVVLTWDGGGELIIHAMKARQQYIDLVR